MAKKNASFLCPYELFRLNQIGYGIEYGHIKQTMSMMKIG